MDQRFSIPYSIQNMLMEAPEWVLFSYPKLTESKSENYGTAEEATLVIKAVERGKGRYETRISQEFQNGGAGIIQRGD